VAEKHVPEAEVRVGGRIVGVVGKRGLSLRYCRFPLPIGEEYLRLRHVGRRIVRL
jgi:hypothetical protein